jgi:uncharacterized protein DUF2877
MLIRAETLGCAIPIRDFDAVVHSVFRRACNLQIVGGGLITLVDSQLGKLPQGIALVLSDAFSFESMGFRCGQRVTCRNGIIHTDSLPLQIDLTSATHWRADLQSHLINMRRPSVRRALAAAHAEWRSILAPNDTITTKAHSIIRATLPQLFRATRAHDLELACQHATRLIGLGVGLTPSGDDALVGFLAGLWSTTSLAYAEFLTTFGQAIIDLSIRTNDISRAYLIHAAQGQVSSILENLCDAISRGAPVDEVRRATRAALSVGHTSGADGVGGLLEYFKFHLSHYRRNVLPSRSFSVFSVASVD